MSTSLTFRAPEDLSVGTVRIEHDGEVVTQWVATAQDRVFEQANAKPGIYTVQIAPAGPRPRTFVFEVQPGVANTVSSPNFSTLAAGGSEVAFSGVVDVGAAVEALTQDSLKGHQPWAEANAERISIEPLNPAAPAAALRKRLTVGLARERTPGSESWRPFAGQVAMEISGTTVNLSVTDDNAPARDLPCRTRLSLALEKVRLERLFLPLYRGGTTIAVTVSALTTSDVALQITPTDPELRGLYRALDAGTPEIAQAVADQIRAQGGLDRYVVADSADPWAAILIALLAIRFPDNFGSIGDVATAVYDRFSWTYDANVIRARAIMTRAGANDAERAAAARDALEALSQALALGAPYYSYTNQLAGELLQGLAAYAALGEHLTKEATTLLARWRRDIPLQRGFGATFSWASRDRDLAKHKVIEPYAKTGGRLERRHNLIAFEGQLSLGRLSIGPEPRPVGKSAEPSLMLQAVATSDPNKGQFGGQASRGGYSLEARFEETRSPNWVRVTLAVVADDSVPPSYSDRVDFHLHPTFDRQIISAVFAGRRAAISLTVWGGFTVGAVLPEHDLQLECDLALLPDAPRIIREL
ncbi:pYEATS domain-containing protein [Sphingomonas sp. KR3-1]|uniref:pYEATS domain-containing protein n=1 Tax=Sphingomonas sp. KR3-1 TaxID=3156611 RepID=UPI0032B50880